MNNTRNKPRWYKGNLHMHSFWSDGVGFPEMIAQWFKSRGYHFIAFTEHDQHQVGSRWLRCDDTRGCRDHQSTGIDLLNQYVADFGETWVEQRRNDGVPEVRLKPLAEYRHLFEESGRFLIMTGEEVTTSWSSEQGIHWINVIHTPDPIPPQHSDKGSSAAMQKTFVAGAEAGSNSHRKTLTFLNHPNYDWNATAENIAATPDLRHMEIYTALNSTYPYGDDTHLSVERMWDIVLTKRLGESDGPIVYGLATDDSHQYPFVGGAAEKSFPGRAWIMVRCHHLTPDHIIDAIDRGDFYASTGVTLEQVHADAHGMNLKIAPESGVNYVTQFIGTRHDQKEIGRVLDEVEGTEPRYTFVGDELYVRARILSDRPHTNPTAPDPAVPGDEFETAWTQPFVQKE